MNILDYILLHLFSISMSFLIAVIISLLCIMLSIPLNITSVVVFSVYSACISTISILLYKNDLYGKRNNSCEG